MLFYFLAIVMERSRIRKVMSQIYVSFGFHPLFLKIMFLLVYCNVEKKQGYKRDGGEALNFKKNHAMVKSKNKKVMKIKSYFFMSDREGDSTLG
jgi:hypothetical protein